ncbi:methylamine utilization protein MauJ [Paracoccus zhejiangensis]|uniref:methylamine utilization protein MauJ n=1 Tax=Paracoccus zhejiangensis TaxID=1077935 RepID=UPI0038CD1584
MLKMFNENRQDLSVEEYVYRNCRVATAHASKDYPSDGDISSETRRLSVAAEIMRALARYYIKTQFDFSDSYFHD